MKFPNLQTDPLREGRRKGRRSGRRRRNESKENYPSIQFVPMYSQFEKRTLSL